MNISRILIVRTDRLGDVILTLPMATAIKTALPSAKVSFLVREYTQPIAERAVDVDAVPCMSPEMNVLQLRRLIRSANAEVICLPSPRFELALAAWLARVPLRVGTGYRWYSFLFNRRIFEHRKTAEHHEAEYNLRTLSQLGVTADMNTIANIQLEGEEIANTAAWLRNEFGSDSAKYVVLHATSSGSAHEWPQSCFAQLAKELQSKIGLNVIFTGTEYDREKLTELAKATGAHLFVGKSLPELAALVRSATGLVSNSTGPGHLAASMGAPSVGLFSLPLPLSKERWGFRGKQTINIAPEPLPSCPNCERCTCMERISVERVEEALLSLFAGKTSH